MMKNKLRDETRLGVVDWPSSASDHHSSVTSAVKEHGRL